MEFHRMIRLPQGTIDIIGAGGVGRYGRKPVVGVLRHQPGTGQTIETL